ncbi:mannonate dehydratase [Agrobacterium rhizogenes]|uniref:mannonate dehydratase n=1 Tax=Rhizobium rhizogenes TaxID=359 RepID=UPI00080FBCEA|nr:mannonate dehydratase [Rhizobium rhizogenes]OCJ30066.1 mannonate dehydratase [Agrobacterium sp. B133/95]NTG44148.1 mannonate dehydratase [Rhizobium rhizogenes]NTH15363.1 mannonate dehydratase [Rhizobium rhizogenes]NTH21701.1 mannonate dehydratase [Rhizobium rhizogenes]NTH35084.1 mannonate dehydratase [Rhizobium rhizogenes]
MESCWRWFGPRDLVPLIHARQGGATGVVTALHEISYSRTWAPEEIEARKALVAAAGMRWSVCESIPIRSAIKLGGAGAAKAIGVWKDTLVNLARSDIRTICYNFMPVVDWTRTDLRFEMPTTALALRFDMVEFVAYDVFILRRKGAETSYAPEILQRAEQRLKGLSEEPVQRLESNIIAGLPGGEDSYGREAIRAEIAAFDGVTADDLRANLDNFLREVVPVAAEVGARLAIHPDDPPISLFGLPRVVSTAEDLRRIVTGVDDPANGLTLCVGSLGSRADNDVLAIAREFAPRINFAHLRDVAIEPDGSFVEASHLEGRSDMYAILRTLLAEEARRRAEGRADHLIPMRPDHGHLIADDVDKPTNPGYSLIGRLKGLAELHGVIHAIGKTDEFSRHWRRF